MKKIYIPTNASGIPKQRQFVDSNRYIWGGFEFIFEETDEYDYLVVLDSLSYPLTTKCPKENRYVFLGEPPYVKQYPKAYLDQFGHVFTCQPKLVKQLGAHFSMPALPWMTGCNLKDNSHECMNNSYMTYSDFKNVSINTNRLDKACLITSNKTFTIGHRERVRFANRIIKEQIDYIDVFGNGYMHIDDKFEVMSRYKYAIVIENGSFPHYWTEKLSDCMLAGCYPIYYGAPNIGEYMKEGITTININNYHDALSVIKGCISDDIYANSIVSLLHNRDKILNDYNMFNIISMSVEQYDTKKQIKGSHKYEIQPIRFRFFDKVKNYIAKKTGVII